MNIPVFLLNTLITILNELWCNFLVARKIKEKKKRCLPIRNTIEKDGFTELQKDMSKYAQVFDSLITGIVVLDSKLNIKMINTASELLMHTSKTKACGKPFKDLILGTENLIPELRNAIENKQPFTRRGIDLLLPDQPSATVDFTVNLLESPSGLLIEIQPLNRLQNIDKDDQTMVRQETTRRLIKGLAHEVKNPLGGIKGAAQLLDKELPSTELREYTSIIVSEAERLSLLVDRMLGPNKLTDFKSTNIYEVFERVIQIVEAENPKRIEWDRDYDPSLPDLESDKDQLIQAILNIIQNANEATANIGNPRITIRIRSARQFTIGALRHKIVLKIEIIDNGTGIAPEMAERIFFPMITDKPSGSGLGLSIAQTVLAQHQGSIQVESKPGMTKFLIHLPFTQARSFNAGGNQ